MTLTLEIVLVTNQELDDILVGILISLLQPVIDILEGLHVSDVVHDDDSVSTLIVRRSDGFESFLTSSVPDLELHSLALDIEGSNFEVDSNRGQEAIIEDIVGETEEQ